MINYSTPILLEIMAFLVVGVPLAGILLSASFVASDVAKAAGSRKRRRRVLRWQRFLFKGRYFVGGPQSSETRLMAAVILWFVRGIVILSLLLWLLRILARLFWVG